MNEIEAIELLSEEIKTYKNLVESNLYPNFIAWKNIESNKLAIQALEKQKELQQLINDIKKDFNKNYTYSVSLVLEMLESIKCGQEMNWSVEE